MTRIDIGGMSEAKYSLDTLKTIDTERLGNYTVLFCGPWSPQQVREISGFCKTHNMKFVMDETWSRLQGTPRSRYKDTIKELNAVLKESGKCYAGSLFMCEYGGLTIYWPHSTVDGSPNVLPTTPLMSAAKDALVANLGALITQATTNGLPRPLICIEAGGIARYLYEAGIDRVDLEMTYHRYTEWLFAATKGASKAYNKKSFGVDMAMVWYGGNQHDNLWFHRWRISLYHAFLRGANPIYAEHGLMDYKALGKDLSTSAPEVRSFRRELGKIARFMQSHQRPDGFPKARVAAIQGNLDSFAFGEKFVWGQRQPGATRAGAPEDSWELFLDLYNNRPWQFPYAGDSSNCGNPPWGQADVIPAESSLEIMQEYSCLVFLGWNTMTVDLYDKLHRYVKSGGHILATLAHFDCRTSRDAKASLYNDGDLNALFGVKVASGDVRVDKGVKYIANPPGFNCKLPIWTETCDPKYDNGTMASSKMTICTASVLAGFSDRFSDSKQALIDNPAITVNQVGRGLAFLVNSFEYPGHRSLKEQYRDLMSFIVSAHERDPVVASTDRIRYAVYEDGNLTLTYLLNTDPICTHQIMISSGSNRGIPVMIKAGALIIAYSTDRHLIVTSPDNARITGISTSAHKLCISAGHGSHRGHMKCYVDGSPWKGVTIWSQPKRSMMKRKRCGTSVTNKVRAARSPSGIDGPRRPSER